MAHAWQWKLFAFQFRNVGVVVIWRAQFVVATLEKAGQSFKKFARSGGLDVVLQLQVRNATSQQHVEVGVLNQLKTFTGQVEQRVAVRVECTDLETSLRNLCDGCGVVRALPEARDAFEQVARGIASVGDSENFSRTGEFVFDHAHDTAGQHRGLAGARTSYRENRSIDVVDGTLLLRREFEFAGLPGHGFVLSIRYRRKSETLLSAAV